MIATPIVTTNVLILKSSKKRTEDLGLNINMLREVQKSVLHDNCIIEMLKKNEINAISLSEVECKVFLEKV